MQEFVLQGKGSDVLDQWLRTSFIDDQGTVYLPCGIVSNESRALLCLAYDGISYVQHLRHIYAPAWWLKKEYPQCAFLVDLMCTKILSCKS